VSTRVAALPAGTRVVPWLLAAVALGLVAGAVVELDATAAIVAAIVVPVLIAVVLRPEWLPPVLVVTVFAESLAVGGVTISRIAAPFALVVALVHVSRHGLPPLGRGSVLLGAAAFATWALASALWSVDQGGLSAAGTPYALGSLTISLIYALVVVLLVRTRTDLARLLGAIVVTAVAMGTIAVLDYLGGGGRSEGYDGDPNFFASLQVFALPFGVVLASYARSAGLRLLTLSGIAVIAGSVITSLSRGGLLAMLAVLLLLAASPARGVFRTRGRKAMVVIAALLGATALAVAAFSDLSDRSESLFSTAEGGSGRANLWRAAITGWEQHPVSGLGFGAFRGESNDLLRQTPGVDFSAYKLRPGGQVAHSAYLGTLVELGVIGLALFLTLLVLAWRSLRAAAATASAAGERFLAGAARGLIVALAGFALASAFLSTETDRALWVLLGLAAAMPRVVADAAAASGSRTEALGSVDGLTAGPAHGPQATGSRRA
jgi:O-antigen ligase